MPAPGPDPEAIRPAGTATPTRPACPTAELLAAWDRGELPAETAEPVAAHVERCAACQAALGALAGSPDALLDGLRHVRQAAPAPGEPTLLTGPPAPAAVPAPPGYELLEQVGQGGMGVVHRARDLRLNREVAVKLLRDDYPAGSAVCARFVAEAQITGQLQHPGIPAVHELGTLPGGRPFLAMKLVKGRTLHELLKGRADPAQERGRFVAVFEQVCQAVGYAHAHRVLHRDLKPSNVMVGAFGEVQVMDWGLAKVLAAQVPAPGDDQTDLPETLTALTAIDTPLAGESGTRTGAVLGTPAYMAPEQAGGEVRKLDARSDVFGLGAILCQLLTGQPPFAGKDANEVRLKAVRGELHEALGRLDESGAEPDLIVLCKRCLAFGQEDRPADGQAVAQEVARIRQAAEERARRAEVERAAALVREAEQRKRRRQLLAAAALVAAVLVAGIVGTGVGLLRARQAAGAERQANEQAQKRLKQVEKGNEILSSVFTDLDTETITHTNQQGPGRLLGVLAQRLVKAAGQLEGEAVGDPLQVAALQDRLGRTLLSLGYPKEAVPLLEKARATRADSLGLDHPDTLSSMSNLALGYNRAGQPAKAVPLYEQTLRLNQAGRGPDDPETLTTMNNLGSAYRTSHRLDKALPLLEEAVRLARARLGNDAPQTLASMNNLAGGYQEARRLDKAVPLYEEVLRLTKARFGADHPATLTTMYNLAGAYLDARQSDKALPLFVEALRLRKAKLGDDHPDTLATENDLALAYRAAGQLDRALPLWEEALRLQKARLGADHPDTLTSLVNLAIGCCEAGLGEKAVPLFAEYFGHLRKGTGPSDPGLAGKLAIASQKLLSCERYQDAEPYLRECLVIREKVQPGAWTTFNTQAMLGAALLGQKKYAEAEPLLLKGYEGMEQREKIIPPQGKPRLVEALKRLVSLYDAWGKPEEAARWLKELAPGK